MTHHKLFVNWLNDALLMEQDVLKMLEKQEENTDLIPDQQKQLSEHAETTKKQISRLNDAIIQVGGEVSGGKSWLGNVMGNISGEMMGMTADPEMKGLVAAAATERFEIATYNKLIAAAESTGHEEVIPLLKESLKEEEEMERVLDNKLPEYVKEYIERTPEE